jgi:hypothetical protein
MRKYTAALMFLFLLVASAARAGTLIVYGDRANQVEINAARELAHDISRACCAEPAAAQYKNYLSDSRSFDQIVFVGTADTHDGIRKAAKAKNITITAQNPGSEAFVIHSIKNYPRFGTTTLLIAGSDARGTLYGVYEFSRRFLGIDPYEFWTGKTPQKCKIFTIHYVDYREKPPVFALRGYFDNDDDMIANWKNPKLIVEFDTWKEMIDSLARLRYNYIDLHDTLGRPEFWNWPYYTNKFDYHTDLGLVSRVIDYAHGKGMMVQIPMGLGWEFHHLPYEKICLSKYYDDWMDVFRYYLEETPLGKADLYQCRPRDPWWDKAYKCPEEDAAGIPSGPLTTKLVNGLFQLINRDRPGAITMSDLWAEGIPLWTSGEYGPDKNIILLWADNGYAQFGSWPDDLRGYKFGIYVHAGYYLNHVMQDPYPDRIKEVSVQAADRGMTYNYFINGQDFKHFILNLEACARAAWDPYSFDPEKFYIEWTSRYFGEKAAPTIVESLKALHEASAAPGGFTKIMDTSDEILLKLHYLTTERIDMKPIDSALAGAEKSYELAEKAASLVPPESELVYDDQILFPAKIFLENLKLLKATAETMNAFADRRDSNLSADQRKEARERLNQWKKRLPAQLRKLRGLLVEGSKWKKWDGWTNPDNFRKITPPPDQDYVERIIATLK